MIGSLPADDFVPRCCTCIHAHAEQKHVSRRVTDTWEEFRKLRHCSAVFHHRARTENSFVRLFLFEECYVPWNNIVHRIDKICAENVVSYSYNFYLVYECTGRI